MAIRFFCEDIEFNLPFKNTYRRWIKNVIGKEKRIPGNLNFIFCSDPFLLKINQEYLNHHYFTDVITFEYNRDAVDVSGDIFISLETVKNNAAYFKCSVRSEISRVMIHGVLHLMGYFDKSENEVLIMRSKEDTYLGLLDSNLPLN